MVVFLLSRTNILFEQIGVEKLRIAIVHNFVQKLVNQAEILSNCRFVQISLKVSLGQLYKLVQEVENKGAVNVGFGRSNQRHIIVGRMNERDAGKLNDRRFLGCLRGYNLVAKVLDFVP